MGSEPELFLEGLDGAGEATALIVVNDLLYFLRDNHANVVDLAKLDGHRELQATRSLIADAEGYYFVRDRDESSNELLLGGASLSGDRYWDTRLPPHSDQASLVVNGNFIYYLADAPDYSALQRREKFGKRDELITNSALLDDEMNFTVDGDDIFWVTEGSLYYVRVGQVAAPRLLDQRYSYDADDYAGFILIDVNYVYWQANVDGSRGDDDPLPIMRTCRAGLSP